MFGLVISEKGGIQEAVKFEPVEQLKGGMVGKDKGETCFVGLVGSGQVRLY